MSRLLLVLEVETEDIGATQMVTLRLGNRVIGHWRPGTRHADTAIEAMEEALVVAFQKLLEPVTADSGMIPVSDPDRPWGDENY